MADQAAYAIGDLQVEPSTRQVSRGGRHETLEPRVMQVLVALSSAGGAVLSRHDLITRCWGGQVVGDAAIDRAISRLRALSAGLGRGAFRIETIKRVGYRMVWDDAAGSTAVPRPRRSATRRGALAASVLAAAAAGAAYWGLHPRPPRKVSAEALALYERGIEAQRQGLPDQNLQAVAFLRQSVAAAPNFADAWGALALSYRHLIEGRGFDDPATAALARSAAARAFALDPGNADARVALILLRPYFRNWSSLEQDIRDALVTYPRHWLLWANLGRVLSEVGRWEEAIAAFARAVEIDPFLPLASSRQALTLWWGGRLQEADTALLRAASRWPAHPAVWFTRFDFLALTGRPAEAAALAQDVGNRPFGVPAERFELSTLLATALRSGHRPGPDPASTLLAAAKRGVVSTGTATLYLCAFDRLDDAFGLLQEDYFGGRGLPPAGLARRYTDVLFAPATAPLRADPRFARMTAALGLDTYWRAAGHGPDDRRAIG